MIKFTTLTPRQKFFILCFDFAILMGSLILSFYLRMGEVNRELLTANAFWFIPLIIVIFYYILGTYDLDGKVKLKDLYFRSLLGSLLGFLIIIGINYFLAKQRMGIFGRGILIPSLLLHYLASVVFRTWLWRWFSSKAIEMEWLILADESSIDLLIHEAKKSNWRGRYYFLLPPEEFKRVDWDKKFVSLNSSNIQFKAFGSWLELEQKINRLWTSIVVAVSWREFPADLSRMLMMARLSGQSVLEISEFYERNFRKIPIDFLGPEWFIFEKGFELLHNPLGLRIKRLCDLFLALLLLLIVWPLMLLAALMVKIESSGPALYRQIRTGQGGRTFTILKFRSMGTNAETAGAQWASNNDPRVTKVGKVIRLTRIDELPQLINVLKGEMSFVGPRPERPEFNETLDKEISFYNLRHLVRPGLTGWAQINYPYGASREDAKEKLQYELFYIKNHSLLLDMQVVLKTIKVVLFGQGR